MLINYDIPKIAATLEDFYKATDININLLKADFSFVSGRSHRKGTGYCQCVQNTAAGKTACRHSDLQLLEQCRATKQPCAHVCHAGLIDAAAPILYEDEIIGYVIFGEMKGGTDFSALKPKLSELGLDLAEMEAYYDEIPLFDPERIQSVSNIMMMLTRYLLLENMLQPRFDDRLQQVVGYINDHLTEELSVQRISRSANISKSVLYQRFHDVFGCTVSEYVNEKRVALACDLLQKTDLSVEVIAQRVGFSGASYFVEVFKRLKGTTPLKFRKNVK